MSKLNRDEVLFMCLGSLSLFEAPETLRERPVLYEGVDFGGVEERSIETRLGSLCASPSAFGGTGGPISGTGFRSLNFLLD
jgi:hypothetical protein